MGYKLSKAERENYFSFSKFHKKFEDEKACEDHLFSLKYPDGFRCKKCKHTKCYHLRGEKLKRRHLIQCASCKKQESLTKGTIFESSKVCLEKWFFAMFAISQTKKGISALLLSKHINVAHSTALMILHKIRRSMEEDMIQYKIGGKGKIVEADEISIGGKNAEKQDVLVLLEKKKSHQKETSGRIRFVLLPDKQTKSIELALIPLIEKGTILRVDGKKSYTTLANKYFNRIASLDQVAHWEENHQHKHLKSLNTQVGNLKKWYRGIHHSFSIKNTVYYLNEFSYRFNRRRSEINIFDRLLKRCVERAKILTFTHYESENQYSPLAA